MRLREFYQEELDLRLTNKSTTKKVSNTVCAYEDCCNTSRVLGYCQKHFDYLKSKGNEPKSPKMKEKDKYNSDGHRLCILCKFHLSTDKFSFNNNGRLYPRCIKCTTLYRSYKISYRDYLEILESQGGVCKICGKEPEGSYSLVVDHDHSCCPFQDTCGKCIRGLLCGKCNTGIGCLDESKEIILSALRYLGH